MMHGIAGDDAFRFVVVPAAGVEVAIEAWEVAARDFDPDSMTGFQVIARRQRR